MILVNKKLSKLLILRVDLIYFRFEIKFWNLRTLQPDLNEALFAKRSGAKKREWKAEMSAQINC